MTHELRLKIRTNRKNKVIKYRLWNLWKLFTLL